METTTQPLSKPFFRRIGVYLKEMFPVLIYLPYVIALYVCLNFTSQALSHEGIVLDIYVIVGMITAFFIMLEMRTFDDLKDFEIDKDLFPWRATARGDVLKSDIQILSLFSFLILVFTNIIFGPKTIIVFTVMMLYALLTFKWFFAEAFHRKNLFFTMMTHQPLPWMINYFLIHTALASGAEYDSFTTNHWILLAIFSLPVTAWEVSRKIRAIGHETHYETFSMIFGARPATVIPFLCLILAGILGIYVAGELSLNQSFLWITLLLMAYVIFFYVRFLFAPTVKNNVLTKTAMIFTTLLFINLLVHVSMDFKVINEL